MKYLRRWFKNNVWHDTFSAERIADICGLWSAKLIFVGYGQLNSSTV